MNDRLKRVKKNELCREFGDVRGKKEERKI